MVNDDHHTKRKTQQKTCNYVSCGNCCCCGALWFCSLRGTVPHLCARRTAHSHDRRRAWQPSDCPLAFCPVLLQDTFLQARQVAALGHTRHPRAAHTIPPHQNLCYKWRRCHIATPPCYGRYKHLIEICPCVLMRVLLRQALLSLVPGLSSLSLWPSQPAGLPPSVLRELI